jgi:hypothetical protein
VVVNGLGLTAQGLDPELGRLNDGMESIVNPLGDEKVELSHWIVSNVWSCTGYACTKLAQFGIVRILRGNVKFRNISCLRIF